MITGKTKGWELRGCVIWSQLEKIPQKTQLYPSVMWSCTTGVQLDSTRSPLLFIHKTPLLADELPQYGIVCKAHTRNTCGRLHSGPSGVTS